MTAPPIEAPAEMVALVTEYTASAVPKSMAQELSNRQANAAVNAAVTFEAMGVNFMKLCRILDSTQHTSKIPSVVQSDTIFQTNTSTF